MSNHGSKNLSTSVQGTLLVNQTNEVGRIKPTTLQDIILGAKKRKILYSIENNDLLLPLKKYTIILAFWM